MTNEVDSVGRRTQVLLFSAATVVVVAATVGGALYARWVAERDADRRIEQTAAAAAAAVEDEIDGVVDSLDGAGVVGRTGDTFDPGLFEVFGADVLARRDLSAIWLVDAGTGGSYRVLAGVEGTGAAGSAGRDVEVALRAALTRAAISGAPDSARVTTALGSALAVVRPIADDPAGVVGFVVALVPDTRIESVIGESLIDDTRAVASLDQVVVVGEPFERRARTEDSAVPVAGRSWTLTVGPRVPADLSVMWVVIAAGLGSLAVLIGLIVVTGRRQRRLLAAAVHMEREQQLDHALRVVVGHLARAITGDEVVTTLRDLLPGAVGAQRAALGLVGVDGAFRIFDDGSPSGGDLGAGPGLVSAGVVGEVLSSGEAAFLSSPIGWRDDETAAAMAGSGSALAILPLVAGSVRGVVAVAYPRFRTFEPAQQQILETVAALAARALDRGRRYDAEHAAAVAFQKAALPDALPEVPGLSIAARYRPASLHAAVGGDWYDVVVLDDHRTLLVVGDVVGHGMEAAAAMGRLRTALRVIATLDPDPGVILHTLGHQVDAIPNAFCTTVLCAVIDRRDQTLSWSRAGHLPPLLIRGSESELLDERCAPPLGVVVDSRAPVHRRPLRAGDRLLLFTDGIVERRDETIDVGMVRLASMAHTLSDLDGEEFTDTLVEAIVPHEDQVDDIAILVVALEPAHDEVADDPAARPPATATATTSAGVDTQGAVDGGL